MLQVVMRGQVLHPVSFRTGERLVFGRDPHDAVDADVGKRVADYRLVTPDDLDEVEHSANEYRRVQP